MKKMGKATEDDMKLVRAHPMYSGLSPQVFDGLTASVCTVFYDKNDEVFQAGNKAAQFFIIAQGAVRLFRLKENGEEATVSIFRYPQSFGEAAIFLEKKFPVTATCITDTKLICIDAGDLLQRIRLEPDLALGMLASMSVHLKLLVEEIALLRTPTAVRRTAEFLLQLSASESGPSDFHLPYPKSVIANRLGVTPEALSRTFAELKQHGIQVTRDKVEIEDIERVKKLL